jgi:hypothetical protein
VLLVAVFAALSFGPATGGRCAARAARRPLPSLPRFLAVPFPIFMWPALFTSWFASWHWIA